MKLLKLLLAASLYALTLPALAMQQGLPASSGETKRVAAQTVVDKTQEQLNKNLLDAIKSADPEALQAALKNGANPNVKIEGMPLIQYFYSIITSRHKPSTRAFIDTIKVLLNDLLQHPQIDINSVDTNGSTLLHLNLNYRPMIIPENILAFPDIDVNKQDNNENTPLLFLINQVHDDVKTGRTKEIPNIDQTVKALLAQGANPNIRNKKNQDAYMVAKQFNPNLVKTIQEGRAAYLKNIEDRKKLIHEQTGLPGPVSNIVSQYLVDPRTLPQKQTEQKAQADLGSGSARSTAPTAMDLRDDEGDETMAEVD